MEQIKCKYIVPDIDICSYLFTNPIGLSSTTT